MPELRTRPRRSLERQLVAPRQLGQEGGDAGPRPAERTAVVAVFTAVFLVTGGMFVNTLWKGMTAEDEKPQDDPRSAAAVAAPRVNLGPPIRPAFEDRAFPGRNYCLTAAGTAAPTKDPRPLLRELATAVSAVKRQKTSPSTFKERLELFKRLMGALSEADRVALFAEVDPAAIERFYGENPERGCALLDKLLKRLRMMVF